MSTKTKIIIVILIVASILIAAFGIYKNKTREEKNTTRQKDFSDMVEIYSGESEKKEAENNSNTAENEATTETNNTANEASNKNNVVGKEEKESAEQNTEKTEEEVAIELAQKEWGLSVKSYNFVSEKKGDGEYEISVRNKSSGIEITRYTVNTKTGTVVEAK